MKFPYTIPILTIRSLIKIYTYYTLHKILYKFQYLETNLKYTLTKLNYVSYKMLVTVCNFIDYKIGTQKKY